MLFHNHYLLKVNAKGLSLRPLQRADAAQQLSVLLHGIHQIANDDILLHNKIPPKFGELVKWSIAL